MTDNEKNILKIDLKMKKHDVGFYTSFMVVCLALAISFGNDVKKDSNPNAMRFLSAVCALGAGVCGAGSIKGIKDYRAIKRELANKVNEKQK